MSEQKPPSSSDTPSAQNTTTEKPTTPSNQVVTKGGPIAPANKIITASLITEKTSRIKKEE
jgi:hypothetical protein